MQKIIILHEIWSILKQKNLDRDYHLEGACHSQRHKEKEKGGYRHHTTGNILICTCIYMTVKNLSAFVFG